MKIVFLNGGFANQIFQYIFYRYAQIKAPGEEWYLDDSFFFVHNIHNGYELEKIFGLYPSLLSRYFDTDVWQYMIDMKRKQNKSIPQMLLENGIDIRMISESDNWRHWNSFSGACDELQGAGFYPEIVKRQGEIYYHGYWLTSEWFHAVENEVRSELVFPEIDEPHNTEYMDKIQCSESCSIHIRRGDYVSMGFSVADSVYLNEVRDMLSNVPDITLFVFSDDMDYCRTHAHDMGLDLPKETVYVEGNRGNMAYRDLQLMSHCKNMINGNSSFCYLAALLNTDLEGIINPTGRKL